MKKLLTPFLFLLLAVQAKAQDPFTDNWNAAYKLAEDKKFDEALAAFTPLLIEQPTVVNTHVQMAWCYLMKKDFDKAMEHSQHAYQLDQLSNAAHAINAYISYAQGNTESGKVYFDNTIWLTANDDDFQSFDKDIEGLKNGGFDMSKMEAHFATIKDNKATRNKNWAKVIDLFGQGIDALNKEDNAGAKIKLKEALNSFATTPEAQQHLGYITAYAIAANFYNVGDSTNYMPLLTRTSAYMNENSTTSTMVNLHMATMLGEHYYTYGNAAKSFEILSGAISHLSQIIKYKYLTNYKADFLYQYSISANAVGNVVEARDGANLLTEIENSGFDEWYQTNGYLLQAQAWGEDAVKAKEFYQKAYDMAAENGFEDLKNSIAENLK